MRKGFEESLHRYGDIAKSGAKDLSKEGRVITAHNREQMVAETAQAMHTEIQAEGDIYNIQKSKQEKLSKFRAFLDSTRGEGGAFEYPAQKEKEGASKVLRNVQGDLIIEQGGRSQCITVGELLTDHEWGLEYTFDESVDIHTVRQYMLEKLKYELRNKLDDQIIISERANTHGDSFKQHAYEKIAERMRDGSEQQGVIAEKMVKNFLKKISIDTNADFEIIDADAHQDVEQKIDFIIHRKNATRNRGAKVQESDIAEDIGIQFTTAFGKSEHKERQVATSKKHLQGIDDLVLVTLPAHDASVLYKKWQDHKTSGGPEKAWSKNIQETIFRGVMNQVLSPDEIDTFCREHFAQ